MLDLVKQKIGNVLCNLPSQQFSDALYSKIPFCRPLIIISRLDHHSDAIIHLEQWHNLFLVLLKHF